MRKSIAVFMLIIAFSTLTFAQLKLGIKVGGNIANLSGSDAGNPDSKFGLAAGAFLEIQLNQILALQPELYYSMKGATDKITMLGSTIDETVSFDYIEVPLLLKLLIPVQGSEISPAIFAGPFLGINTTASAKVEFQGQSAEQDIPNIKSTEFGLQFGGGIGLPVGNNELGFDIRYILGLTSLDDSAGNADVKNGVINFNAFYAFSLL